jgi:hypothetical protein
MVRVIQILRQDAAGGAVARVHHVAVGLGHPVPVAVVGVAGRAVHTIQPILRVVQVVVEAVVGDAALVDLRAA